MPTAVAGATGSIGALTVAALEPAGRDVVRIRRSLGVDLIAADGLDAALTGVEAVIDTTSYEAANRDERSGVLRHHDQLDRTGRRRRNRAAACPADRPTESHG